MFKEPHLTLCHCCPLSQRILVSECIQKFAHYLLSVENTEQTVTQVINLLHTSLALLQLK